MHTQFPGGLNTVGRMVPGDAAPAKTVVFMDDRCFIKKNAWFQWSGQVGLIENESKVSLAVKSHNLPVPDHLASFVQSPVRALGAYTAVTRRRMCPDEENCLTIELLKPSRCWLPFNFPPVFHQYVAMPQASYGCSRLPTAAASSSLWSAVRRGDGKCFAGPQPGTFQAQWALQDLNRQVECQIECQIGCQIECQNLY